MTLHNRRKSSFTLFLILGLFASAGFAYIFCPDVYQILQMSSQAPWSAVGYINNGCSGVLIDSRHVLAAAHCFVFDNTGAWQQGLQFYPNFHPDRPSPPRSDFTRFVVGTRVSTGGEFEPSDWGIGALATPVAGFQPVPIRKAPASVWADISSAGYPRDYKILKPRTPGLPCTFGNDTFIDCDGKEQTYSRCYWAEGIVDPQCKIYKEVNGELFFDCRTLGGNSGAPLFWSRFTPFPFIREYFVTGVIHGPPADPCAPCQFVNPNYNVGPSADRFRYAPQFAEGVGVARVPNGSLRTHVIAADRDQDRLVGRRHKLGTTAADFAYFDLVNTPPFDPIQVEAFNNLNGSPVLMAVSRTGALYAGVRFSFPLPLTEPLLIWFPIPLPSGYDRVVDLDPLDEADNTTNEIYLLLRASGRTISNSGAAFRLTLNLTLLPPFVATSWEPLPASQALRVAAIRRPSGIRQVFFIVEQGDVSTSVATMWQAPGAGWSSLLDLGTRVDFVDIDATFTETVLPLSFVTLFGVSTTGAVFRNPSLTGDPGAWFGWSLWDLPLYAPDVDTPQPPPGSIRRVTATRWQESAAQRPAVFSTDNFGNIYFTEETCAGSPISCDWSAWRSFYH